MMGRIRSLVLGLLVLTPCAWGDGMQALVDRSAAAVSEVLGTRYQPTATVTAFDNYAEISDLAAQKFYQLLVARLEETSGGKFRFIDNMVAFSDGRGRFSTSRQEETGFLIALKMIRQGARLGVGITVFSRETDRLEAVRYVEESIPAGELRVLNLTERAFVSAGFTMSARMQADPLLMDVCSCREPDGTVRHYFLKPGGVDVFEWRNRRMERLLTLPLDWGRPYYPARRMEGRILVFHNIQGTWLTAGSNVSSRTRVFHRLKGNWEEAPSLDFVPLRLLSINGDPYLAGARYAPGRNYFSAGLVLMPLSGGRPDGSRVYEKPLPEAYAMDFTLQDERLAALHLVDREYHYRVFTTNFEKSTADERLRGAALAALGGEWVALSDYTRGRDRAFFFKTVDGGRREVYEAEFPRGEIRFIRPGEWEGLQGFWICLQGVGPDPDATELQFWHHIAVEKQPAEKAAAATEEVTDVQD